MSDVEKEREDGGNLQYQEEEKEKCGGEGKTKIKVRGDREERRR